LAIKNRSDADTWQQEHEGRAPKKRELAPDFTLSNIQGKTSFTLSDFRGLKPVALVFGSFT
jgi:hypothetical protein